MKNKIFQSRDLCLRALDTNSICAKSVRRNEGKMQQAEKDNIIRKLIDTHTTISTMESCTSGLIASMITDTEGASAVFPGGYVTYLNETKIFIGVDENVIRQYGVYSKECARAMAETVKEKMHTDIAVGITGTTGNVDPNNADSMQGNVFFCILTNDGAYDFELNVDVARKSRHEIKQLYADNVFEELGKLVFRNAGGKSDQQDQQD